MRYIVDIDSRIRFKAQEFEHECDLPVCVKFSGHVDEVAASKFCEDLAAAENHALKSKQEIIPVIIDSFGGDAYALLSMVDAIKACNVRVATIIEGKAMSAGAFLFTCGAEGYRYIGPNATVMIHEVASWMGGKSEELKAQVAEIERLNENVFSLMAKNCGKKERYFLDIIHDKKHADWYLDAKESLKHNLANHIGIPTFKINIDIKQSFEISNDSSNNK